MTIGRFFAELLGEMVAVARGYQSFRHRLDAFSYERSFENLLELGAEVYLNFDDWLNPANRQTAPEAVPTVLSSNFGRIIGQVRWQEQGQGDYEDYEYDEYDDENEEIKSDDHYYYGYDGHEELDRR